MLETEIDYKDEMIRKIAESQCERLCRKIILALQKMTDCLHSGDDSILQNMWDEVCVQVQGEESVLWGAYLDTMEHLLSHHVQPLEMAIKQAIWLQTDESFDWECEDATSDDIPYCEDDIVYHILHEYVLSKAVDWSNARIEQYLGL